MKSKFNVLLIAILAISLVSCLNGKKKSVIKAELGFTVIDSSASIKWTAYKTTDKKPVSGVFNTINITKSKSEKNPLLTLNGVAFSIPVSSIFSKNEDRDNKLQKMFFNVMANTALLTGVIHANADNMGSLEVTMNGTTNSLPLTFTTVGDTLKFKGVMNLEQWQATAALNTLNKACFDLHKGPDGVSKTWNDVLIEASVVVKK
ncbi:MAG: YceI family protein [Flavobacteriaceae bacterium]